MISLKFKPKKHKFIVINFRYEKENWILLRSTYQLLDMAAYQDMPRAEEPPRRWASLALEWTDEGHLYFSEVDSFYTQEQLQTRGRLIFTWYSVLTTM